VEVCLARRREADLVDILVDTCSVEVSCFLCKNVWRVETQQIFHLQQLHMSN
jgi:hypothetical protein